MYIYLAPCNREVVRSGVARGVASRVVSVWLGPSETNTQPTVGYQHTHILMDRSAPVRNFLLQLAPALHPSSVSLAPYARSDKARASLLQ